MELPFPSPGGVMDSITSPALMCDTMHKVVPAREVHQSPSVQNFFFRTPSYSMVDGPHSWSQSVAPPEVELMPSDPKLLPITLLGYLVRAKNHRWTKTPLLGMTFHGLSNLPPEAEHQGQTSLAMVEFFPIQEQNQTPQKVVSVVKKFIKFTIKWRKRGLWRKNLGCLWGWGSQYSQLGGYSQGSGLSYKGWKD